MPAPARPALAACVVLAAAALLAGCSGSDGTAAAPDPDVVQLQPGEPGEPNQVITDAPPEDVFPGSPFTAADVAFMRDMQVHHEQALAMTAMVEDRTDHEDLRLFVRRMEASQEGELDQLERLLAEHDEAVRRSGGPGHDGDAPHDGDVEHDGGAHDGGAHDGMPGMLADEDLAALEAAEGDEFVRLFLVGMSRHHEGALVMVADLLADDTAATDPRLAQFAEHVDSDQRIEIDRMARMYAELPPAAGR